MPIITAAPLVMSEEQRAELTRMAASSVLPHRQVVQARALLWAGDGVANEEIARRSGVDSDTVRRWRKRFADKGTAGVGVIAKGRGASVLVAAWDGGGGAAPDSPGAAGGWFDALDDP
jgi:transposase-like protein